MKAVASLDAINNGYARLLYGEEEREQVDVPLTTLQKYIKEPIEEAIVLELTFSNSGEVVNARKLVEETEKRRRISKALIEWLLDGIYSPVLDELKEKNV